MYNIPVDTIVITMGDPGGIGPEVTVKALDSGEVRKCCNPVVIGNAEIIRHAVALARLPLRTESVSSLTGLRPGKGVIKVFDTIAGLPWRKCVPSENAGRMVVDCVKKAVELALTGEVRAIVTAPASKESLSMSGCPWPGHTELLADLTGTKRYAMMFVSERLKVILSTIHVPLRDVPGMINRQLVTRTIELALKGAGMLGIRDPHIAVAGLNPHAGESGILGREELEKIQPALRKARGKGIAVSGPYPPDVVFHRASRGEFDMVVCMYHDQGLIPFKMLAFDTGVNVTVGLPVIRTSPDHGTAFDIAWKNRANPSSMIEAIKLAARLKLKDRDVSYMAGKRKKRKARHD